MAELATAGKPDADRVLWRVIMPKESDPLDVRPLYLDEPEEYMRLSPIRHIRDIDVPMLIIHSENDLRCPISQAEELFMGLRYLGKDVTFYRFPGETHELSRSGHCSHGTRRPAGGGTAAALAAIAIRCFPVPVMISRRELGPA